MSETQVRDHVRKLRRFYTDAFIYVIVNIGLILIWAISGGGYFWPIWVIIGWGIGLGVHAFSLGLIPQMNAMVPFMTAEWEDKEVRRLMETGYKGKEKAEAKARKKAVHTTSKVESATVSTTVKVAPKAAKTAIVKSKRTPKVTKAKAQPAKKGRIDRPKKIKA